MASGKVNKEEMLSLFWTRLRGRALTWLELFSNQNLSNSQGWLSQCTWLKSHGYQSYQRTSRLTLFDQTRAKPMVKKKHTMENKTEVNQFSQNRLIFIVSHLALSLAQRNMVWVTFPGTTWTTRQRDRWAAHPRWGLIKLTDPRDSTEPNPTNGRVSKTLTMSINVSLPHTL